MHATEALRILSAHHEKMNRTSATADELNVNLALGTLLSHHRQLQQKHSSTKSQLTKCEAARASIHLQLRRESKSASSPTSES